jgi:hypothetical protein
VKRSGATKSHQSYKNCSRFPLHHTAFMDQFPGFDEETYYTAADSEDLEVDQAPRQGFPDRLNTPILTTQFDALRCAYEGVPSCATLRPNVPLARQARFWAEVRRLRGETHALPAQEVDTFRMVRQFQRAPPQRARYGPSTVRLCGAVIREMASRGCPVHELPELATVTREARGAAQAAREMYSFVRRSATRSDSVVRTAVCSMEFFMSVDAFLVVYHDGTARYAPLNLFLSTLEILEHRARIHTGLDFKRSSSTVLTHTMIEDTMAWQHETVSLYGSAGFPVAKAPEAMFKARAGGVGRVRLEGLDTLSLMADKYRQKERALSGGPTPQTDRLEDMARRVTTSDDGCELSGVLRLVGYPIMNPATSAGKSRRLGMATPHISIVTLANAVRLFSHLILKNYIEKHGSWPPMVVKPGAATTALHQLYTRNVLRIRDRGYPLEDWDHMEIGVIKEFNYYPDYLKLIDDKGCFEGMARRLDRFNGMPIRPDEKRLLASTLNTVRVDTKKESDILSARMENENLRGANLYPKNQEFKPEARMFTIIHPEIRRPLSIVQENVKEIFFPYLPYTSMAMSPTEIARALHSMTAPGVSSKVKIELDFSSWNLAFTETFSEAVGHKMDQMAGTVSKFGQSHAFFRRSEFCVTVPGMANPGLSDASQRGVDTDSLWRGDGSGKEGIEQRFWTVLTILIVYLALFDEPYEFILMGQGDNQTLTVDFGALVGQALTDEVVRIEKQIGATAWKLNHEAKLEEFMSSLTLQTYSKNFYDDGRELDMFLKQASKISPGTDELSDSPEIHIGGFFSTALAAARKTSRPLSCWMLACFEAETALETICGGRSHFPADVTRPLEVLRASAGAEAFDIYLGAPQLLGGMSSPFTSFLVAGNADPLAEALSCVKMFSRRGLQAFTGLAVRLYDRSSYTSEPDLTRLVEAPFSIPLQALSTGQQQIHDLTVGYLGEVRNDDVRSVAIQSREAARPLKDALVAMRPIYPEIVRDLYEISAPGRAAKIVSKFKAASSVIGTVLTTNAQQSLHAAQVRRISASCRFIHACVSERRRGERLAIIRSDEAAQELRGMWLGNFGTQGIEGVSAAQPLDYATSNVPGPGVAVVRDSTWTLDVQGPHAPYFGSTTRERRSTSLYEVEDTPATVDLARLVASYTAGSISPEVEDLYRAIAASRTDVPLERLREMFPNTIGGTVAHRYDSLRASSRMQPTGIPTARSYLSVDTDDISGVSASNTDYNLPVQAFISFACALHQATMACDLAPCRIVRIRVSADNLIRLEENPRMALRAPPIIPPLRNNPLMFTRTLLVSERGTIMALRREPLSLAARHPTSAICGALYLSLISCGPGSLGSEGISTTLPPFDVAAAVAVGGMKLFAAAARAIALASVWHYLSVIGDVSDTGRHSMSRLLDSLSGAIARVLYPVLARRDVDVHMLIDEGLWQQARGGGGRSQAERYLQNALRGSADAIAMNEGDFDHASRSVLVPGVASRPPFGFVGRHTLIRVVHGWFLSGRPGIGPVKHHLQDILRAAQRHTSETLEATEAIFEQAPDLVLSLLPQDVGDLLHTSLLERCTLLDGNQDEIMRALRRYQGVTPPAVPRQPAAFRDESDLPAEAVLSAGTSVVRPLLTGDHHAVSSLTSRMHRPFFGRSSVARAWAGILRAHTPALVVGTGTGGIQRLLLSQGVRSVGLDLASEIPYEERANFGLQPPDCRGLEGASYSRSMFTTSGDWMDPRVGEAVMYEEDWATVIIDIQAAGRRFGLELLDPIVDSAWTGVVYARMYTTSHEAESVYSVLREDPGVRRVDVYLFGSERPTPFETASVVFRIVVAGRLTLPAMCHPCALAWPEKVWPTLISVRGLVRHLFASISGGLFREVEGDVAAIVLSETNRAREIARGTVAGGTLLMTTRYYVILDILQRAIEARDFGVVLLPREDVTIGVINIRAGDRTVQYALDTYAPAIFGRAMGMW